MSRDFSGCPTRHGGIRSFVCRDAVVKRERRIEFAELRRRLAGELQWSERLHEYGLATAVSAVAVVLCAGLERWLPLASLALVFLCAVLLVAVSSRTSVSIYTALLCFLAYNFFFTEPRLSLRITLSLIHISEPTRPY